MKSSARLKTEMSQRQTCTPQNFSKQDGHSCDWKRYLNKITPNFPSVLKICITTHKFQKRSPLWGGESGFFLIPIHICQSQRKSVLNIHWKDWCWSWNSNPLATWCEEPTHFKRPWYWERLKGGGEGDDRGWDGWMASPTQRTWVWVGVGNGQGGLACCSPWGRKEPDMTERLNWTDTYLKYKQEKQQKLTWPT